MRWIGSATVQVRNFSEQKDFRRVAALANFWKKYKFRHELLASDQPEIRMTRSERTPEWYHQISLRKGCPRTVLLPQKDGKIENAKEYIKGHFRNAFVRGIGLQEEKDEFLENCNSLFFEVLRSIREGDFSNLTEFTLGGNETLQFHRSAAHKLIKTQKEALNITEDDFLGDNGYIMKYPYLRQEMGPYIHSIEFTNVDANGNTHPMEGENQGDKVFCRYKVVRGAVYKYESLRNELSSTMWSEKIKTPKDYIFRWPRYTFVELDICQQAYSSMPIKLDRDRYLYDFHVFSF